MHDIATLEAELDGIEYSSEAKILRIKSHDFHWFSPMLIEFLSDKLGQLWVLPKDEDEVLRVLKVCRANNVPVTVRGGATGNYGQCVPLNGGVILDIAELDTLYGIDEHGVAEVGAGAILMDIDRWARTQGWELKIHSSTKRIATIAGFLSGGGGGMGSVMNGVMGSRGNLLGIKIATMQDPPMFMDLVGNDTAAVVRSYGTTGVITRVKLALKPAEKWRDVGAAFPDFETAARFGVAFVACDGVPAMMCQSFDGWLTTKFGKISEGVPDGWSTTLLMVAPAAMLTVRELVAEHGGVMFVNRPTAEAETDPEKGPLYEAGNNHAMLHVHQGKAGEFTTISSRFPPGTLEQTLALMNEMCDAFPDEMWKRGMFSRSGGRGAMNGGLVVRWSTRDRFLEMNAFLEAHGIGIANTHSVTIEDSSGGRRPPYDQLSFKHKVDPLGLLNPGKMGEFTPLPPSAVAAE